jgi:hypothetical protein
MIFVYILQMKRPEKGDIILLITPIRGVVQMARMHALGA